MMLRLPLFLRSAANRIALIAFAAFALATLLLGIAILVATHAAFSRQIDSRIAQAAASLETEFQAEGVKAVIDALIERKQSGPDALDFALFDPRGRKIGGDLEVAIPTPGWHTIEFTDPVEGPDPARSLTTVLRGGYRLVVAEDLSPLEDIDRTVLAMFGIAFAGLMALGIGGAVLLARFLRQRLSAIRMTADAIIAGDLGRRAVVGRNDDEFDRAAASLNTMLDRIADLIANLRQVTGDLAHDLRTPLSRLRNQLETLGSERDESSRRRLIEGTLAQADEVLALFDAILRISEVEEGSLRKAFAEVAISDLIADLGETMALLAEDSARHLVVETTPGLSVTGDRELIAQAVINLVENARRHTPEGSTIRLSARAQDDRVVVAVTDNGPGIPSSERERVQQRFVRLETARSTPGHGLGLSLVRAIAEAHGATLRLDDASPGALRPGLAAAIPFPSPKP